MSFNRDYMLIVTDEVGSYTVTPPFRFVFSILKSTEGGLNKLNCKVFGLGPEKRKNIAKEREKSKIVKVEVFIGYQNRIERIFVGNIERSENILTANGWESVIESFDGGFDSRTSFTSKSIDGGVDSVNAIIEDMPNTSIGKITQPENLVRPRVLVGNSKQLLDKAKNSGQEFFIDNERVFIIADDEYQDDYIPIVSATTGLMRTPSREFAKLTTEMLIHPYIKIGNRFQLESKTAPHFDGIYRSASIKYDGDTEGPDWKMLVEAYLR